VSPTEVLYHCAVASSPVPSPSGKSVVYQPLVEGWLRGRCYLCGAVATGKPKGKVIKDTFTDQSWAKAPDSDVVCDYCAWALSYKFDTRNYSMYARGDKLDLLSRPQIRSLLISQPDPPYVLLVAVSGQKWLHFKGHVGYSREQWDLMLEERRTLVRPSVFACVLQVFERLYQGGHTKEEILSASYQGHRIQTYGIADWEKDEAVIGPFRGSRLLDVVAFVAQKGEVSCSTALTPAMKTPQ